MDTNKDPNEFGDSTGYDVFLHDRTAGTTVLLSHAAGSPTTAGNFGCGSASPVAEDGRYWALTFDASNLVAGQVDTPGSRDIFLYDRMMGTAELISHTAASPTTAAGAFPAGISADGRWFLFTSESTALVAGQSDFPDSDDVFLFDRTTGTNLLVSRTDGSPLQAAGGSWPRMSEDGRFVVFESAATNLVAGVTDENETRDIFLYDRTTGTMSLVSRAAGSASTAADTSYQPSISADGASIVFRSNASDLIAGLVDSNGSGDVFLFERATGTLRLVSRTAGSATTTSAVVLSFGSACRVGNCVLLFSTAADVVSSPADLNGDFDVFVFDLASGSNSAVSVTPPVEPRTSGTTVAGTISADGRWVVFASEGDHLVPGQQDLNTGREDFLFDRLTGTTTLVSHANSSPATAGDKTSTGAWLSADGSHIAFASSASDLVAGQVDINQSPDLFLWKRSTGATELISHRPESMLTTGNHFSHLGGISADGRSFAFVSAASDLVPGDFNNDFDLFLHSSGPAPSAFYTVLPCRIIDTRKPGQGPALAAGVSETWTIPGACGIPATAKAISVNVTVTQPTGVGHLSFAPGDFGTPQASTINFGPGQTRANNAVLPLALNGLGTLRVSATVAGNAGGGTVHVLVDVNGYFE